MELKPCPFCGGKAKTGYAINDYNRWGVYCTDCGASVEAADWKGAPDTEEEAIASWNRRADYEELSKTLADHDEMLHAYRHVCNGLSPDEVQKRISQPRWISVEERLPEERQDVLVALRRGEIAVDYYQPNRWGYSDVTHWVPLPEPPKDGGV